MSNLFDKLEIPTIEDVIKKYEVAPKNNTGNSPMTKVKGPARRLIPLLNYCSIPILFVGFGYLIYRVQSAWDSVEYVTSVVQRYADIDDSGIIDSDEERSIANEMLSGIAKSNNARYYRGKVRTYDDGSINYCKGFYCGDEVCDRGKVEEWVKAYDQEHKGERK